MPDDVLSTGDMGDVLSSESTDIMNVLVIAEYTGGKCSIESWTIILCVSAEYTKRR